MWNDIFTAFFIFWLFATIMLLWRIWRLGINRMNKMEDTLTRALDRTLTNNERLTKVLEDKKP